MRPVFAPSGTRQRICASQSTTKPVDTPLNWTSVAPVKFAPESVTTTQIYRGAAPFIGIQLLVLSLILLVPEITTIFL